MTSKRVRFLVRRDSICWWAEIEVNGNTFKRETCLTRWGARWAARRMWRNYFRGKYDSYVEEIL